MLTFLKLDTLDSEWCLWLRETDEMLSWPCFSLAPSVGCWVQLFIECETFSKKPDAQFTEDKPRWRIHSYGRESKISL